MAADFKNERRFGDVTMVGFRFKVGVMSEVELIVTNCDKFAGEKRRWHRLESMAVR